MAEYRFRILNVFTRERRVRVGGDVAELGGGSIHFG